MSLPQRRNMYRSEFSSVANVTYSLMKTMFSESEDEEKPDGGFLSDEECVGQTEEENKSRGDW